jgi:hypothetical protein
LPHAHEEHENLQLGPLPSEAFAQLIDELAENLARLVAEGIRARNDLLAGEPAWVKEA